MQPFFLKTKNNNKNQACLLEKKKKKKKKQLLTQPVMMCPLLLPRNRSPFCPEKWVSLSNVKVLPMICKDNWVRHQLQATRYHLQMLRTELKWRKKLLLYSAFTDTWWLESKVQHCKVMNEISTLSFLKPNPYSKKRCQKSDKKQRDNYLVVHQPLMPTCSKNAWKQRQS